MSGSINFWRDSSPRDAVFDVNEPMFVQELSDPAIGLVLASDRA